MSNIIAISFPPSNVDSNFFTELLHTLFAEVSMIPGYISQGSFADMLSWSPPIFALSMIFQK